MDKLEEIYDYIVDAKREDTESNVFNKVDIKDSKEYIRELSGVGETQLNEIQKHAQQINISSQLIIESCFRRKSFLHYLEKSKTNKSNMMISRKNSMSLRIKKNEIGKFQN